MAYITLAQSNQANKSNIKIMLFTEGTILKPQNIFCLYSHKLYLPIGDCVSIIKGWEDQGAEIVYCTSRKKKKAAVTAALLSKFSFPGTRLYYRQKKEKYKDLTKDALPDILIEDNCRSIGGAWQMCITQVEAPLKEKIKSVVVKEFGGIDHLPRHLNDLLL